MADDLMSLEQWLEEWESAVLAGQSTISKDEAIRRFRRFFEWENK